MFVTVVTTITTRVDVTTFDTEHDVEVEHDDGVLPRPAVLAAALGGARSTVQTLEGMQE